MYLLPEHLYPTLALHPWDPERSLVHELVHIPFEAIRRALPHRSPLRDVLEQAIERVARALVEDHRAKGKAVLTTKGKAR